VCFIGKACPRSCFPVRKLQGCQSLLRFVVSQPGTLLSSCLGKRLEIKDVCSKSQLPGGSTVGHCLVPGRAADRNGAGLLIPSRMVEKGLVSCFRGTPVVHLSLMELLETSKRDHRIIESFGSEGTPRGHPVQPPRSEQGHR